MLASTQDYQAQLFNTGDDSLLGNMERIADAILAHYPDHVESLTNRSIALMLRASYDAALASLLHAQQLAPKDPVVLSNAAHLYFLQGDTAHAIAYYELMIEHGDEEAKGFARARIKALGHSDE